MPRRPGLQKSHFRQPLNVILASEGTVRVLREIVLQGRPLSVSVIAERTGLSRAGIQNALEHLVEAGVVRKAGVGHGAIFEIDPGHPFISVLRPLFLAEHSRYLRVLEGIREAARSFQPEPMAVWLFGSVARGEDSVESDFDLAVIVLDDEAVEHVVGRFRESLEPLSSANQVHFSVVGLSLADVERLASGPDSFWRALSLEALPVCGPRPDVLLAGHPLHTLT